MSDITVNITTISTSVNVTDNEVSVAVSFIPVDVTLNFEYGVSRAVIDSLLTKENITGLKETDSPEFSSLQSKALQSATNGGQIPDTDYSWFKGLFAGLQDKFIFSWIYGLITLVKDALTRIGLLEDKYILRYVVPVDTSSIDLTTDKYGNQFNFVEGDEITVSLWVNPFVGEGNNRVNVRINRILSSNYFWSTNSKVTYFAFAGSGVFGHSGDLILKIVNKRVLMKISVHTYPTATTSSNSSYVGWMDIDVECINSITLFLASSSYPLPAGTVILIKKR